MDRDKFYLAIVGLSSLLIGVIAVFYACIANVTKEASVILKTFGISLVVISIIIQLVINEEE